jgi:Fic-DOC domain mobile mystery protein B
MASDPDDGSAAMGGEPISFSDAKVDGETLLDPDEAEGLLPDLQTQRELNEWEQANILKAYPWAFGRASGRVFEVTFALELHRRMFDETWQWAGQLRRSDKSIGAPWHTIPDRLKQTLDNAAYWTEHRTYAPDETAVRFHHQLVSVHPFPNGNGRHSRLMADVLLHNQGLSAFTWGSSDLSHRSEARELYLSRIRTADRGDYEPLLRLARQ